MAIAVSPGRRASAAGSTCRRGRRSKGRRREEWAGSSSRSRRWCYKKIPLPEFCQAVADVGLTAIDLLEEKDWPSWPSHGLVCSMGWKTGGGGIPDGLNDPKNHDMIVSGPPATRCRRPARLGVPNLIAFFGNRKGMPDDDAIRNCVVGLNRVKKAAEDHGVTSASSS